MKLPGVSIVVCCYNSTDRLPQTLKHIAYQQVPHSIHWEVILVDNNSTDDTTAVAEKEWEKYALDIAFTVVKQPVPGLHAAREKGIETASYNYLIFCDDDNWLSKNYIQQVFTLFEKNPDVAIIGSKSVPVYASKPPQWFRAHEVFFALGTQGEPGNITDEKGYVWGAGMAVRTSALKQLKKTNYNHLLTDRAGNKMTTGGDVEICFSLRFLGYKIYYTEACYINHYMPVSRFDEKRFVALAYQNGFSTRYLNMLYDKELLSKKALILKIKAQLKRAPKRYAVLRQLVKWDFDREVQFKGWQGELFGLLYLLMNYNKIKHNFNCLEHSQAFKMFYSYN